MDFRGSGDSDGRFVDTTYTRQITDCIAAMDFVGGLPSIDAKKIYLLGWSQGGLVAAVASGRTNRPAGVALWTSVGEPKVSFPAMIGHDAYKRGLRRRKPTEIRMPWGASVTLGHDFFVDVENVDPLKEIAATVDRSSLQKAASTLRFLWELRKNSHRRTEAEISCG
ncbi:alpha/beta fold hydrolase [Sinorhizobium sp. CB7]|uniref:alpha/beta fold hydrolase n=1 Tax=Sinorhizobium sp. CB7 TaxID=3056949 RepID=UPI0035255B08